MAYVAATLKNKQTNKQTWQKMPHGDAYKWHSIFEDLLGKECNHNITSIFEEEGKHDLWYLWP